MIIRTTLNDNDFTEILENFYKEFWKGIFLLTEKHKEDIHQSILDNDEYHKFERLYKKTGMNSNQLSDKDKEIILDYIKRNIIEYYLKYYSGPDDNTNYFKENLKLSFVESVKDNFENGEVVYYFTTQDTFVSM